MAYKQFRIFLKKKVKNKVIEVYTRNGQTEQKMILEAIVHPLSISYNDSQYDPEIHIAVEVLSSTQFAKKMIGIPVTAYHHGTLRAVETLYKQNKPLTAPNMRQALTNLHKNQPTAMELAKSRLSAERKTGNISLGDIWKKVPDVIDEARGPGVFGSVTKFWRQGDKWMVEVNIDPTLISALQFKLIKCGGALGEVSLTHAVVNGEIEPLELSFTIQGLRTGSAINRIIVASRNKTATMTDQILSLPMDTDQIKAEVDNPTMDSMRLFYESLTKEQKQMFLVEMSNVKTLSVRSNTVNEKRLAELEKAYVHMQEATAHALNEFGPSCFGAVRNTSVEEWTKTPASLATTNSILLCAAATHMKKRRREDDELSTAIKELTGESLPTVVTASRAKINDTPQEEAYFSYLREMRKNIA